MIFTVKVKPGSKKGPLVERDEEGLKVFLRERPHDGEANEALIRELSKYFGVAKSCIIIKSGSASKRKIVEVIDSARV